MEVFTDGILSFLGDGNIGQGAKMENKLSDRKGEMAFDAAHCHFLGLSLRMSAFLVLQFGMSAASVHCYWHCLCFVQVCTSLFFLSRFMQSSWYGSRLGRSDITILFFLHVLFFRIFHRWFGALGANFGQVSIGFLCFSRQENVELRGELHKLRAQMPQVDLGGKNQLGRVENSFCLAKR